MKSLFLIIASSIFLYNVSCEVEKTKESIDLSLTDETDWTLAKSIVKDINAHRKSIGKDSVTIDYSIPSAYASKHNYYMIGVGRASHDFFGERMYGIKDMGAESVGEVVAYGYFNSTSVVRAWLKSDDHRPTIEGDFDRVGISVNMDTKGLNYYTVLFFR